MVTTKIPEKIRFLDIFCFHFFFKRNYPILSVLKFSRFLLSYCIGYQRISANEVFTSLFITFFFFFWSGLISGKISCNTCNKSVSGINLIEYSLCLTIVHLKYNNLTFVETEIMKNTDSDRFGICMFCSSNYFLFPKISDNKLYQN